MYQLKMGLLREFAHEAKGTKSLFQSIPQSALDYRSQPHLWSIRDLAAHIISIYNWYDGVFNSDAFDLSLVSSNASANATVEELNLELDAKIENATKAIENWDETTYLAPWKLVHGDHILIPETAKIGIIRGMLMSHLYHHRGEMIAHLRTLGHAVPGLYGPTFEQMQSK